MSLPYNYNYNSGFKNQKYKRVRVDKALIEMHMLRESVRKYQAKTEYVYFVYAPISNLVKIGKTKKFKQRIRSLRGSAPEPIRLIAIMKAYPETEKYLHHALHAYRQHGEWFLYKHIVKEVIDAIKHMNYKRAHELLEQETWAYLDNLEEETEEEKRLAEEAFELETQEEESRDIYCEPKNHQQAGGQP